ncbi:MAG: phosphoglycerate kinase [Alphaproteobacteria bacterium]|nr:phosphoglycerate kinase [Alphaproteobacteria bacterium]
MPAAFRSLDQAEVQGRRVLLRVDLNLPMQDGRVTDLLRVDRVLPTIRELTAKGAHVILLAHFGRPDGKPADKYSLRPIAPVVAERLGAPVAFAPDCVGPEAERAVARLRVGEVLLLENTRFHAGEEKNDADLARRMAGLGDLYVNDAFSCAHRAHVSTEALAHLLPAYAGRNMQAELEALDRALGRPERPVAALVGGAKVSTKLDLLGNLAGKVDHLVIGGGMANTFLAAQGRDVGRSLCERDLGQTAREILAKAAAAGCRVVLPVDAVVAREFKADAAHETVPVEQVPANAMILDIGPRSVTSLNELLAGCRTLVWNGPLGAFETRPFDRGTVAVARQAASLSRAGRLISVAGGGDTVAALAQAGVAADFTYVSTAGGAFLEWMEGKVLPGVQALAVR